MASFDDKLDKLSKKYGVLGSSNIQDQLSQLDAAMTDAPNKDTKSKLEVVEHFKRERGFEDTEAELERIERRRKAKQFFSNLPTPEKRQSKLEPLPIVGQSGLIVTPVTSSTPATTSTPLNVTPAAPATQTNSKGMSPFGVYARDLKRFGKASVKVGKYGAKGLAKTAVISGKTVKVTGKGLAKGYSGLSRSRPVQLTRDIGTRFEQRFLVPEEQQISFFDSSQLRKPSDKTRMRLTLLASGVATPEMEAQRQREINLAINKLDSISAAQSKLSATDPRQSVLALEFNYYKQRLDVLVKEPRVSGDVQKISAQELASLRKLEQAKESRKEKALDILHVKRKLTLGSFGRAIGVPLSNVYNPQVIGENVKRATSRKRSNIQSGAGAQPTVNVGDFRFRKALKRHLESQGLPSG